MNESWEIKVVVLAVLFGDNWNIISTQKIHKLTWVSPGRRDKIQLDHIVVNGEDVSVRQ